MQFGAAMLRRILTAACLFALAVPACVTDEDTTDEVDNPDGADDAKADTAAELSVRAGDTTLWVRSAVERRGDTFYLHARTSRNLASDTGRGYVFDDVYGAFAKLSPRVFEVGYGKSELGPLMDGVNLFVGFEVAGPRDLTARAAVRPRLVDAAGSSKLAFTAEVTPVVVDGLTVFRAKGRSTVAMTSIAATAGGAPVTAALVDATHFTIDLPRASVIALAGTAGTVEVTAQLATGAAARHAHLGFALRTLGLTTGDAYDKWPVPKCTAAVKTCLAGVADGIDLSGCGDAITVLACRGELGAAVDGAAISSALATTDARLADTAGFVKDAPALVGTDLAAALGTATRAAVSSSLDAIAGRWYPVVAARDARVTGAVDAAFDRAYAHPQDLVGAHAPVVGDEQRARDVAADALLAYLATTDYEHSEFGRSYDQLVREFRAQHVQSLREFREAPDDIFVDSAHPNEAIYIGQWLGTHTEITIDRTTGAATHVLVELD